MRTQLCTAVESNRVRGADKANEAVIVGEMHPLLQSLQFDREVRRKPLRVNAPNAVCVKIRRVVQPGQPARTRGGDDGEGWALPVIRPGGTPPEKQKNFKI